MHNIVGSLPLAKNALHSPTSYILRNSWRAGAKSHDPFLQNQQTSLAILPTGDALVLRDVIKYAITRPRTAGARAHAKRSHDASTNMTSQPNCMVGSGTRGPPILQKRARFSRGLYGELKLTLYIDSTFILDV